MISHFNRRIIPTQIIRKLNSNYQLSSQNQLKYIDEVGYELEELNRVMQSHRPGTLDDPKHAFKDFSMSVINLQ